MIYITRHGESMDNVAGKIGGNSSLTSNGLQYAQKLKEFFKNDVGLTIWCSELKRSKQTAQVIRPYFTIWKELNEINAGVFDETNFKENFPYVYQKRYDNKYYYRYLMGESYEDLVNKIKHSTLLNDIKKVKGNLLIVGHQAICRVLLHLLKIDGFLSIKEFPHVSVELHTLFQIKNNKIIQKL